MSLRPTNAPPAILGVWRAEESPELRLRNWAPPHPGVNAHVRSPIRRGRHV